jgi:DNA-binding beta-propeller fold protein YncE
VNPNDILVSNFNNSSNLQGTGTTIVRIQASGPASVFFQGMAPLGLTTALNVLQAGFVLVGNFPSPDLSGNCATAQAGSILVINKKGKQVGSIVDPSINGPWDSALFDQGSTAKLFVANGLSGTIVRLDLAVNPGGVSLKKAIQIASGYGNHCDPVTFVDAPTGLVYDSTTDVLFVASTVDNAIFAVSGAGNRTNDSGTGTIVYQDPVHLHGPLAMAMAPNGHLIVSNNDAINPDPNQPSEIVEFTTQGAFVRQISVDQNPGGSFGLNIVASLGAARFAFVDDNVNALSIWTFALP